MNSLDKTLRSAIEQHEKYEYSIENYDLIRLFAVVKECATGRGAHSIYVSMMRFINLKQKSTSKRSRLLILNLLVEMIHGEFLNCC
jgi:hypothetical protein